MKGRKGLGGNAGGNAPVTAGEEGREEVMAPSWPPKTGATVVTVEGHEFGANRRARVEAVKPPPPVVVHRRDDGRAAIPPTSGPAWVRHRLLDAGDALRRTKLPSELSQLAGAISGGLPTLSGDDEEGKRERAREQPRVRPSAKALDDLDECLGWLLWLGPDARPVVFGVMLGYSLRRIAALDPNRRSKDTLRRVHGEAINDIWSRLSATPTTR